MPCSSLAFFWITKTEHQVFLQTGYHVFLRHASALYMHADLAIYVQRLLNACRDSYLSAEIAERAQCAEIAKCAQRCYLCAEIAKYAQR